MVDWLAVLLVMGHREGKCQPGSPSPLLFWPLIPSEDFPGYFLCEMKMWEGKLGSAMLQPPITGSSQDTGKCAKELRHASSNLRLGRLRLPVQRQPVL